MPRLWVVGLGRIVALVVIAFGAYRLGDVERGGLTYLLAFYAFGFCGALWNLISTRRKRSVPPLFLWAQVLVDFGVVAATVSFTGGPSSFFTFLFVIVILEAGLILGLAQGFVFAALATAIMLAQIAAIPAQADATGDPGLPAGAATAQLYYSFIVQTLAFFFTASMSGYWNQRIRRLQQFQREILDNMNSGFLISDRGGVITAQNKAADAILQIEAGAAVGRPVQEVLRVDPEGQCPVLTALRAERDFTSYEFHARVGDDESKLLGLSTSRIYDSYGRLTGIIASFVDLTEMETIRGELQRQDRLAAVGELAAGVAHEIRNPVAAIRGAVDELHSGITDPELARKLAFIALRESDHLNRIVSDFLDFARQPQVNRELLDVRDLIEEVATLARHDYPDVEGLVVETHCPDTACVVSGDRSQIKQVFVNLGKNAVEAMQGWRRWPRRLSICATVSPVSVEVRFDDDGPGIEPDKVARIFEPFYTTKPSGVGMGLAVCQRIITAHDGTIRAMSRESGGASMRVQLPLARHSE